jgi:hypothetical protein
MATVFLFSFLVDLDGRRVASISGVVTGDSIDEGLLGRSCSCAICNSSTERGVGRRARAVVGGRRAAGC